MKLPLARLAVRVLAASVALGAVASGVGVWSRYATRREHVAPPPRVLALQASEVRNVAVESAGKKVELARSADGSWLADAAAPRQSETLMSEVEGRLFPLGAYRSLRADGAAPAYGLVDPEITFRVKDTAGHEHQVLLGAPTFTSGGVYASRGSNAHTVYLVPRRMMDDLRSLLAGKRIDQADDIQRKTRELNRKAEEPDISWWLQQALDTETPGQEAPQ